MKKTLLLACLFLAGVSVFAQSTPIINDPDAEARSVGSFNSIQVSHAFDVYLTQDDKTGLAVSATKPEYKQRIITEVSNGVLKIYFDNGKKWKGWNSDKMKLRVYISFKELKKLDASGACNIHFLTALKGEEVSFKFSGATDMKNADMQVNRLNVELSGASDMKLKGKVTQLKVDASGASDFKSMELIADYCDVKASGASTIHITVNKELSAQASGASDVRYKGEGMIREIKSSGASTVSRS